MITFIILTALMIESSPLVKVLIAFVPPIPNKVIKIKCGIFPAFTLCSLLISFLRGRFSCN